MEIIAAILFIVFFVIGIADKNKKKGNAGAQPQAPEARARKARAAQPARSVKPASAIPKSLDDLKASMNQWFEDTMDEIRSDAQPPVQPVPQAAQGASMMDDPECAGGSMAHTHDEGHSALEDEDCFGGSMAHTHSEGVNRAAHARRMAAIDAHANDVILPETIDARALRRAVVMAEVLGKPRGLRKY